MNQPETPVFAEPWEANAFALAVQLSEQGLFTWKEWASALADTLKEEAERGEPDDGSRYYHYWLATLERLVIVKGLADQQALRARKEAWIDAYRTTPHGRPVELRRSRWSVIEVGVIIAVAAALAGYWLLRPGHRDLLRQWSAIPAVSLFLSAGFGSLLGLRHALEPDHLAAVATLMTGERSSARAAWLGACWGVGHTLTLLATGAMLVGLRVELPGSASDVFEVAVIVLLIGFGVRSIVQGVYGILPGSTHTHTARQAIRQPVFARRPLLVGAVHGLAGSGALTAFVVSTLPSTLTRLSYLALFGLGSTAGMAVLSGLLGWPLARVGGNRATARSLSLAVGCISTCLGLLWSYPLIARLFSN